MNTLLLFLFILIKLFLNIAEQVDQRLQVANF